MSSRKTIVYTRRPEPILFEGFVGQKTSMRQWKRRYFVLFKSCIVAYAAKPPAGKPLEVFPLTTYHYISQLKGKEECRFDLLVSSATSRHTCEYLAATGEGARLWVAFIKQAAQDYQAVKPDFDTSGKFWKNPVVLAQCVPANTFRPRTEDYLISGLLQRRGEAAPTSGRASVFRTAKPKSTDNWVFISSGKGNRPAGIGVSSKKTVEAELFIPATAIKSFTAFGLGPYGFDIVFKQEAGDEVTLSLTTKTEQDCEAWCVALEKVTGFSATETSPRSIESPSLAIRSSSSGNSPPRESFPKKIGQKTIGFSGHWFRLKDTAGSQPGSTRTSPSVSVSANSQSPSPADSPWATLSASGRRLGVDEVEGVEEDRLDVMLAQLLQDEKHGDTARRQVAINAIGGFLIQGGADPDSLAQGANAELAKEKVSSTVWAEIRKEMHRIKQEKEKFAASAASQPRPSPPSPFLPPPALLITGSEFGGPALPLTPGGGLLSPRDSAREHRVERMSPRDHLDAQDKDHRLSLSRRLSRSVSQQMARRSTSMASQAATQSPAAGGKMGPGALSLTVPGAAGAVSSSSSSLAAAAGAASPSLSSSSSSSSSSSAAAAGAAAPATPAAASVPPSPRSAGLPADVKLDADGYPWYEDINTGVVQAGGEQAPFATYAALSLKGQIPGTAKPNQDRAIHLPGFAGNPAAALFGVFDGHGPTGHLVSAFVIKEFPKLFEQELLKRAENETIAQCASAAFRQCNTNLFKTTIDIEYSGSTGIVIYLDGAQLWCFNVGDSRAILAQRSGDNFSAAALSRDHKPDDAEERKRIEGCGGRCEPKMTIRGPVGTARVWLKDQNIPGLAVARAFGDKIASTIGVIADPEIKTTTLKDGEDAMIILASDGIWEFMDNLDVVAWAAEAEDAAIACKDLVEQSCWIWEEEDEARDDITVITIFLRGHVPLPRQDYSQDYQDAPAEGYSADAAAEE
eukprot:g17275.t1